MKFQKHWYLSLFLILLVCFVNAQDTDVFTIRKIYDYALTKGQCYEDLAELCQKHPGRIAGSEAYLGAADLMKAKLTKIKGALTTLQSCQANYWMRGDIDAAYISDSGGKLRELNTLSLGNSVGTPEGGILANVVEIKSLDEVDQLGVDGISGKIIFYNRPMDPTQIRTFNAYGGAVDQRVFGASRAAKYGAAAVLVRSVTTIIDDVPHTGTLVYEADIPKIAAMAISTSDANMLSERLSKGKVDVFINTNPKDMGSRPAPSVIAEIKGSEFPDEIILVGGHLDSWDVGEGAHDDGAGCVQSMDVLRILTNIGYKPKRTIRCVLFSNEENGLAGGIKYAEVSNEKKEFHLAAIESDAGGFTPRGFSFESDTSFFKSYYSQVYNWSNLLEPYGIYFEKGGSGADISPLKSQGGLLVGLRPDSQRYFDIHHTKEDTFDKVNKRELELGAAAMASLVYLIDKYGLTKTVK